MKWQKHYWLRLRHYYQALDKCFDIHFTITDTTGTIDVAKGLRYFHQYIDHL
jgi:hypothetical protein